MPSHGYSGEAVLNAGTSVTKTCVDGSAGRAGRLLEVAFADDGDGDDGAAAADATISGSVIGCSGMGKREANTWRMQEKRPFEFEQFKKDRSHHYAEQVLKKQKKTHTQQQHKIK